MKKPELNNMANKRKLILFITALTCAFLFLINCNQSPIEKKVGNPTSTTSNPSIKISMAAQIGIEEAKNKDELPYQFPSIRSVDCDNQGNLYVLVGKEEQVRVFDEKGKFLTAMLSRGQGPNEINNSIALRINDYTNTLFLLHEQGYALKEFDLAGNFLRTIILPSQFYNFFNFMSKDNLIYVSPSVYGKQFYNNLTVFKINTGKISAGFLKNSNDNRSDTFNIWQRFELYENLLWTSTIDSMSIKALDVNTGKILNTIDFPGDYRKNIIYETSHMGQQIVGLLAYNFVQPLVLKDRLFFLLTEMDYDLKMNPKWQVFSSPIRSKLTLFKLGEQKKVVKLAALKNYDFMQLECTYKNKIILSSNEPYYQIKIIEVKNIK